MAEASSTKKFAAAADPAPTRAADPPAAVSPAENATLSSETSADCSLMSALMCTAPLGPFVELLLRGGASGMRHALLVALCAALTQVRVCTSVIALLLSSPSPRCIRPLHPSAFFTHSTGRPVAPSVPFSASDDPSNPTHPQLVGMLHP